MSLFSSSCSHVEGRMRIIFLILTNAVLALATTVPRPENHRFHENDQQLSSHSKTDSETRIEEKNGSISRGSKGNRSISDKKEDEEYSNPWNLSKETDRVQFQIEGHEGPETYIFGFDTGYGKSRQYRLEERHRDGTVKGQYGYYDAKGKLRTVRYIARPFEGYMEKHHETSARKLRN